MDSKKEQVLESYKGDVERWKVSGATHYKDIQKLEVNDVLFMRVVLHPTKRKASKDLTKTLVEYLCDKEIATADDIYKDLGVSDNPVLKRLKIFQQFGLIRRERKKYYLPTPRMHELRKRYLKRICD